MTCDPGSTFCMEPPVVSGGKFKGQLFVLIIIFSDIDIDNHPKKDSGTVLM